MPDQNYNTGNGLTSVGDDVAFTPTFSPVEGRTVVYQIAPGEYRPAQIVKTWGLAPGTSCNLVVFLDGANDVRHGFDGTVFAWLTSRIEGPNVGQWLARKPD